MTTVISRLYADAKTANAAVSDLKKAGFKADMIDVIKPGPSVLDAIAQARVGARAAAKYAEHLTGNNTLVVARAPVMPLGAAMTAINCVDGHQSINAGVADQNEYIREQVDGRRFLKVMTGHPRFITQDMTPGYSEKYGLVTAAFGMRALKPHRTKRSATEGGGLKSKMFRPMPHLKKKEGSSSAISGGAHMSKFFWPMPLVSRRQASAKTW